MIKKRYIYGVAYNDSDYSVYKRERINGKIKIIWTCPFYRKWKNMLRRCYSKKELEKYPTYEDCSVCDDWLTFSNFRKWMISQDWKGKDLDKDLIYDGNKVYNPESCVFVHKIVNTFILGEKIGISNGMTGSSWDKLTLKYRSRCCNPFTGKYEHLGRFSNELDAHIAWKKRKHQLAVDLADSDYVTDSRVKTTLKNKYL